MAKALGTKDVQGSLVLHGTLALVFGFVAVFWPGLTITTLVYLVGTYLLVTGVLHAVHGAAAMGNSDWWFLNAVLGVVEAGFGIYLLRHVSLTFKTFILLIGLAFIVRGVMELVSALFSEVSNNISRYLALVSGVIAVAAGVVVLYQKASVGVAFVWILGVYAILLGALQLSAAKKLGE